ncbi:hypothetical protein [Amycolatopsis sp. YIM 10]|uniref:hypothetical protein n=1 Tax=Amycolatopsis sp. YIM 10 TaxID=2653857 RepID=UPI0012905AE7|nr:hypothetical protein [Amycolatopsis sp. YIM 10]QFU89406.1 hypothetical protein YIM_21135 [Amycolatopsis sp. YIM 10]
MSGPSGSGSPEELARELRAKARVAATAALREGLVDIDNRHGQHMADEVVALLDIGDIFDGLVEAGRGTGEDDDEQPYELNTKYEW